MISINGRNFHNRSVTGIQRYIHGVTADMEGYEIISAPRRWTTGAKGHIWEQLVLPHKAQGLLWSPSNTGPIAVKQQVVTIHDLATFDHPEWFNSNFSRAYKFILPRLSQQVEHILTVSEFSKRRIIEKFGISPDRITVTHLAASNMFVPTPFEYSDHQELGLPERYFLMVGTLQERKNFRRTLEVWDTWGKLGRPNDLALVIIGANESIFSSFKLYSVPDGVKFMGRVDDQLLPRLYSSALAFLFPSLYEGFGIPILEAMACGTPVITSNVTSMPEVAGKAALLVNPELHVSILQAMQAVASDAQLRDELRASGLERARQFNWERAALQTRMVLEQAAQRQGL